MVGAAGSVQIQQLLELLAVVSSFSDQESAVRGAVERAAQAFEAEVAAVIVNDRVVAAIGFPAGATPDDDLLAVARRELDSVAVPRLGDCHAVSAGWAGAHPGHLVLARFDDPFAVEERSVIRGMARILELSLTMLRSVETLRQRQKLLEHLFNIQRAISRRQPLDQILSGVTSAAQDLLGDEIVELWLMDPAEPDQIRLVAHIGLSAELSGTHPAVPIAHAGAAGGAITSENLVVHHGNPHPSTCISRLTNGPLLASMAAPVHDSGTVTGSLLVGSHCPDRTYTSPDMQTLRAFAEHISLALTDANTVDRMHQAFHDSLTGLASRGLFIDRLAQQLRLAGHAAERVALLFVDLDRFKEINDTLGHAAGDTMLTTTAQRLKSQLRETDIAARFGGDEFAILLGRVSTAADAATVAERILRALDQPLLVGGRQLQINASIGIALSAPGRLDPAELIRNADIAMYQAKRNGRGCYATFTEDMQLTFTGEGC